MDGKYVNKVYVVILIKVELKVENGGVGVNVFIELSLIT